MNVFDMADGKKHWNADGTDAHGSEKPIPDPR